jgi:sugar lactone lactonase YvrE
MLAGDVLSWQPRAGAERGLRPDAGIPVRRLHVGRVAAAIRPRRAGGLVVAIERGFAVVDAGSETPRLLAEAFDDPSVRMNDGGCDPQGRFYCGSMAYDEAPGRGALYQLDAAGRVRVVRDKVSISNGMAWSIDGSTVYHIDSPTQRVDAFDFGPADGSLTNPRPLMEIDERDGKPDGMTIDSEGGLRCGAARPCGATPRRASPTS